MSDTAEKDLVKLSQGNLANLPEGVLRPNYERSGLTPGIVHIGVGNFHRAHQSWYLHRLMQQGLAHDWAIVGAGVRPFDKTQRRKLAAQDYLTTLLSLGPDDTDAEIVGSMIGYVPVEAGNGHLITQMSDPGIRIVSITVTEGGYYVDPATGGFDKDHPDIQHDAASFDRPNTAFGAIVGALARRRASGVGPFTLQSCDNLQGNGSVLRQTVVSLARLTDPDLADWIDEACTFPNSMVDCIVPSTGRSELELTRSLGIDDQVPVTHENFRQWVIEDKFCAGRPPYEEVGAQFSDRVHDFEKMKIRILNAGHQLLANASELLSIPTVPESMANPQLSGFFRKVVTQEIAPVLASVPGMTAADYVDLTCRRFSNPRVADTTRRNAHDGSARHATFLHPSIRVALDSGGSFEGLALAEALWARMCAGTREDGSTIPANAPDWEETLARARVAKTDPSLWLSSKTYGGLNDDARFSSAFTRWLKMLWEKGTIPTIGTYLQS